MQIFLRGFIPDFLESSEKGEEYFEGFIQDKIVNNRCHQYLQIDDGNGKNIRYTEAGKVDIEYYIEAITVLKDSAEKFIAEIVQKTLPVEEENTKV